MSGCKINFVLMAVSPRWLPKPAQTLMSKGSCKKHEKALLVDFSLVVKPEYQSLPINISWWFKLLRW
jgi:hypothetical protein